MRELELSKDDVVGSFKVKKRIIDRIEHIKANSPQELEALEAKLKAEDSLKTQDQRDAEEGKVREAARNRAHQTLEVAEQVCLGE